MQRSLNKSNFTISNSPKFVNSLIFSYHKNKNEVLSARIQTKYIQEPILCTQNYILLRH